MSHHHHHGHHHQPSNYTRAFIVGLTLNGGFVMVEVFYGFLSHSLALLADAGHNISDVLGLLLAWGASFLAQRPPTQRYVHLVMPTGYPGDAFLAQVSRELHDKFGIEHSTLQVETGDPQHPCTLAPEHLV